MKMIKYSKITVLFILLFCSLLSAEENSPKKELKELQQRIDQLSEKLAKFEMEEKVPKNSDKKSREDDQIEELQILLYELESRLDEVERDSFMDKLDFGLDFRTTINNYFYKDDSGAFKGKTAEEIRESSGLVSENGSSPGIVNLRMRLKMNAELFEKMRFTGWLTSYKLFNGTIDGQFGNVHGVSAGYYPDAKIYLERFYIDYFPLEWLSFTLGRCPSTDGYPYNIKSNNVRLGTYNEVAFNMPFDSLFINFLLDSAGIPDAYLRLLITTGSFLDYKEQPNLITSDFTDQSWYFGLLYEMRFPGTKNGKISFNTMYSPALTIPMQTYENKDQLLLDGSIGQFFIGNLMTGFENIGGSNLSLYGAYTMNIVVPPDRTKSDDGIVFAVDEDTGAKIPLLALFGRVDGKPQIGHMFYAGAQYSLPITLAGQSVKTGADYNYGTKKFYNQYVPDTTGFSRFLTRGHFFEGYLIIPFHFRSHLKIGYIFKQSNYAEGLPFDVISETPGDVITPLNEKIHNIYGMVEVFF
ncbi:MAG: DUF3373 family protein [bacterium]